MQEELGNGECRRCSFEVAPAEITVLVLGILPVPDVDGEGGLDGGVDLDGCGWFQACFNGPNSLPACN